MHKRALFFILYLVFSSLSVVFVCFFCSCVLAFIIILLIVYMALLEIIQYPDVRLSVPGTAVDRVDDTVKRLITDMFETHYGQQNCAALAATQLDTGRYQGLAPPRITVIDFSEKKDNPLCLVNPVIVDRQGETFEPEGCMSVYAVQAKVRRAEKITVSYLDESGVSQQLQADGFLAKCIQHEMDHLDGVLFIDHLPKLKQKLIRKKLLKRFVQGGG